MALQAVILVAMHVSRPGACTLLPQVSQVGTAPITIVPEDGPAASIVSADVPACQVTIQAIDTVLLPKQTAAPAPSVA